MVAYMLIVVLIITYQYICMFSYRDDVTIATDNDDVNQYQQHLDCQLYVNGVDPRGGGGGSKTLVVSCDIKTPTSNDVIQPDPHQLTRSSASDVMPECNHCPFIMYDRLPPGRGCHLGNQECDILQPVPYRSIERVSSLEPRLQQASVLPHFLNCRTNDLEKWLL